MTSRTIWFELAAIVKKIFWIVSGCIMKTLKCSTFMTAIYLNVLIHTLGACTTSYISIYCLSLIALQNIIACHPLDLPQSLWWRYSWELPNFHHNTQQLDSPTVKGEQVHDQSQRFQRMVQFLKASRDGQYILGYQQCLNLTFLGGWSWGFGKHYQVSLGKIQQHIL